MNQECNGFEITTLMSVYYKFMSEGQFVPAQAIAQTLFEITSESEESWGLFWPIQYIEECPSPPLIVPGRPEEC